MKAVIQRVSQASVTANGQTLGEIDKGILLLLGIEKGDSRQSIERLANRILNYRIFTDDNNKMNLSLKDVDGGLLIISQFTLVADTSKGNRPGFSRGASPAEGEARYLEFVDYTRTLHNNVQTGQFGADMQVSLINDGPVTFHLTV